MFLVCRYRHGLTPLAVGVDGDIDSLTLGPIDAANFDRV